MAVAPDFVTGTITLTTGNAAFTTAGANLVTNAIKPGDTIKRFGLDLVIDTVTGENAGTLTEACPTLPAGISGNATPLRIRRQSDGSSIASQARNVINAIGDMVSRFIAATATVASKIVLYEGTNNGAHKLTFKPPDSMLADRTFQTPDIDVTIHTAAKALLEAADATAQRTAMGLGTAATQNTGTSGASVPLLNGANTWSAFQTVTGSGLNAGTFGPGLWINNLYSGLHGFALQQYQDSSGRLSIANPVSPFTGYLTINQAGNVGVGVGNTDPTAKFHIYSNANLTKLKVEGYGVSLGFGSEWRAGTDTAVPLLFQRADGTTVGSIGSSSTATAYNTSSDYRLKYDVVPLVEFTLDVDTFDLLGDNLRRVMLLNPVRHKWLTDLDAPETHGFIAHEAQAIVPHAVTGEKDAVVDIGRAVIPARVTPARTLPFDEAAGGEPVELPAETIPEQVFENITEGEAPEGSTWTKTGERPIYQGIDTGKLVADLTAAVQELTLLVIDQQRRLDAAGL